MCCTKKVAIKIEGQAHLSCRNRLAQPVEASVLDAAIDEDNLSALT